MDKVSVEAIREAVWKLEKQKAYDLVQRGLAEGLDPVAMLQGGVIAGLQVVGEKFGAREYFLAELVMGGKVSEPCIELITPHLPPSAEGGGTVVTGAGPSVIRCGSCPRSSNSTVSRHKIGINIPSLQFIEGLWIRCHTIGPSAFVTTIPYAPRCFTPRTRGLGLLQADHRRH